MKHELQQKLHSSINVDFEPTINMFDNGIIVNYKKVGTRFLRVISSGNEILQNTDNRQLDLQIVRPDYYYQETYNDKQYIEYNSITKYVITPFDNNSQSDIIKSYSKFKNPTEFLDFYKKDNFTDLFFNSNITFLIRNPFERFFSGITQIMAAYRNELPNNENERNTLKYLTKLTDSDIKYFVRYFDNISSYSSESKIDKNLLNITNTILLYILDYRWGDIFQDIHTENYLYHFLRLINNSNDRNKVKIIDLSHLKTKKACEYFCNLRGDDEPKKIYSELNTHVESNKYFYNNLIDYLISEDVETIALDSFIKSEYGIYNDLKKSSYFLDLSE